MSVNLKAKPFCLSDEQVAWVETTIAAMSLEEKVEQLMCPLLYSNDPGYLTAAISQHRWGGVMFRSNPAREVQTAINTLQANAPIPLIICQSGRWRQRHRQRRYLYGPSDADGCHR